MFGISIDPSILNVSSTNYKEMAGIQMLVWEQLLMYAQSVAMYNMQSS